MKLPLQAITLTTRLLSFTSSFFSIVLFILILSFISPVFAATIDVTTCDANDLINAINTANGNSSADTINLQAGCTYTLTVVNNDPTFGYGRNGLPIITTDITINGNGSTITRSNTAPEFRFIKVDSRAILHVNNTTMTGGYSTHSGGAIFNYQGTLVVDHGTFFHNMAIEGGAIGTLRGITTVTYSTISDADSNVQQGGGLANFDGTLTIDHSVISDNHIRLAGGGILNECHTGNCIITITNSTITNNGVNEGSGGAIFNYGLDSGVATLNISNSTFSTNTAYRYGGAVENASSYYNSVVNIDTSTFSGNRALIDGGHEGGGAINNNSGTLNIKSSTFINNVHETAGGGAIFNGGAWLYVTNSTFSGNGAAGVGGAIENDSGNATILSSTFSGNIAADTGGAIFNKNACCSPSGVMTVKNILLADNTSGGNCGVQSDLSETYGGAGLITSTGHNLSSDTTCASSFSSPGDLNNTNAQLGPLQDNGGPTQTYALQTGSPAIDGGDNVGCPATDQRGITRPQGLACDIGAYEFVEQNTAAIQNLIHLVQNFNLLQGISNSLDVKLENSRQALTDVNQNNDDTAILALQAFINAVEAQRGNKITNDQANQLIAAAQAIINNLSH